MVGEDGDARGKTIELPNQRGFLRLQLIALEVERTLLVWQPHVVVVEGYAYCRNISSFVVLVEVGTMIRSVLHKLKLPWYEVSPTTLKKWITGRGNATKDQMALAVVRRWNFTSPSDDIVDAFSLAQMGQLGEDDLALLPGVLPWRH